MESSLFRTELIEAVRAFDAYAWKDSMDNPGEYENLAFKDWFELFVIYVENKK